MSQDHQTILCPYCGHTQRRMERCEACGGSFDAVSRRGVAVNMGPWSLHDERVPFRPGFHYTAMCRLIRAGKVGPDTIVRGPSTQQLWAPARLTPGIAHLVGLCHRCEAQVSPDAAACPQCEQRFETVAAYNELGLPFETGAQAGEAKAELDREVARSGGRSRPLTLWRHPDVPMLALCPYCGSWQKDDTRCGSCDGVFDQLSQRAAVIAMGPWFVRNKGTPFKPGCSYLTLREQIDDGAVEAGTILRGPTTRQFWSVARNVPGVSHLVGFCWSCGSAASAEDAACASCGSKFGAVAAVNALGLPFASEEAALAAEQELEARFNPTKPPTPTAPPPAPGPAPSTKSGMSHAAAGQAAFTGLDRAALAVIAASPPDEPQSESVEALSIDENITPAPPAPPALTRSRRRPLPPRKRPVLLIALVALIGAAAIAGVIFIAANRGAPEPQKDHQPVVAVDETVDQNKDGDDVAPAAPDAKAVREKAAAAWASVRDAGREGQIGLSLDNVSDLMARAEASYAEGAADRAAAVYAEAIAAIETIQMRLKRREEAIAARSDAANLLLTIDPSELPPAGTRLIQQTKLQFDEAQIYFDGGQFEKARDLWTIVEAGLVDLPERASGLELVEAARKDYLAAVDPNLDDEVLAGAGGQSWRQLNDILIAAARAVKDEQWSEAAESYHQAALLAPAVMELVKPIAIRYWSSQAGILATRAWQEHVEGETLDPKARAALAPLLVRLKVPTTAIDRATLEPASKQAIRKLAATDLSAAIKSLHGTAAGHSFEVGAQLAQITAALEAAGAATTAAALITDRLPLLSRSAESAGFTDAIAQFADALGKVAADLNSPAAVEAARKLCADMLARLGSVAEVSKMSRP